MVLHLPGTRHKQPIPHHQMNATVLIRSSIAIASALCLCNAQETRPTPPEGGPRPFEGGREGMRMRFNPLQTALDTNNDGTLDEQEIANAPAALKKLDKNNDGKLNPEELRPPMMRGERGGPGQPAGNPGALAERLMQFDKNTDGKLSKDELPERMQAMLEKGDLDKDGSLSKDEITKLAAAQTPAAPERGQERRREHDDD